MASTAFVSFHQNVKLIVTEINGLHLSAHGSVKTYKHWIAESICNPARPSCYLGECEYCSGFAHLQDQLKTDFEKNNVQNIVFKQWVTVDRSNLETMTVPADSFVDKLSDELKKLTKHDFIAKEQSSFLQLLKQSIKVGEFIVQGDFAENYSFVVQDAIQSYHWTNSQAIIHPFVIYYKTAGNDKLQHTNFSVISDIMQHNTISVYLFQKKLLTFLRQSINRSITKIFYFSDGSAAQYKNRKNFINLTYHYEDFNCLAEWHFFATSQRQRPM